MTGIEMMKIFWLMLGAFLLADLIAYFTGQTLSQWLILQARRFRWFAWMLLAILVTACALLIVHFELPEILVL